MSQYVKTPDSISFRELANRNFTLSPSVYKVLNIPNSNCKTVRQLLSRSLCRTDLGQDVGSVNYIPDSTHFLLRTKALQSYFYIPEFNSESLVPIFPQSFVQMNLKKGDIIISKDSNIGEIVILDKDYPNYSLSGALYRLPVDTNKYYLLAFLKHSIFREQLDYLVPKGATIRHAKTLFLDCLIPFPNCDVDNTILYIENLTKAIIDKEIHIKERYNKIISIFDNEIRNNQNDFTFVFSYPRLSEVRSSNRLDAKIYSPEFKEKYSLIKNYIHGVKNIYELGFSLSRGQNLQISNIGESIYSSKHFPNFYTLILPKFISIYGIPNKVEYLGNPNSLKTLQKGDLIFGAEGFEKGRSIVVVEELDHYITNIHGITIKHEGEVNLKESIFVKCYLDYLRKLGLIEAFAVGGNGGSFAQKYWDALYIPNFPDAIKSEISNHYFSNLDLSILDIDKISSDSFLSRENSINEKLGIYELDKYKQKLQTLLNEAIQSIIDNKPVNINYNIYNLD